MFIGYALPGRAGREPSEIYVNQERGAAYSFVGGASPTHGEYGVLEWNGLRVGAEFSVETANVDALPQDVHRFAQVGAALYPPLGPPTVAVDLKTHPDASTIALLLVEGYLVSIAAAAERAGAYGHRFDAIFALTSSAVRLDYFGYTATTPLWSTR